MAGRCTQRTLRIQQAACVHERAEASVPGARCPRDFGYDHCYVGVWKSGGVVTDVTPRNGRMARISIGYIVD
jgi:hypothetical protein